MYFVKDLNHINKWLNWSKVRYRNSVIEQVPHWNLTYILNGGVFCVPNPKVRVYKVATVDEALRIKHSINYTFYGMKKADSMNRRLMLKTYANNTSETNKVYPLADWSNKEVLSYMKSRRLPQPIRYSKNASGGVGFNIDCYLWMRKNEPQDLENMLKAFPMSEKILYDFDRFKKAKESECNTTLSEWEVLKLYKQRK